MWEEEGRGEDGGNQDRGIRVSVSAVVEVRRRVEVGKSGKILCEDLGVLIKAGPSGRLEEEIWMRGDLVRV